MMILTALLGIGFIFTLAGDFVLLAKVDEYKRTAQEEHDNYCVALRIGNTNAKMLDESQERERCSAQAVLWYADMLRNERNLKKQSWLEADALQDRLSALLCPHNDHVWEVSDAYRGECRCKKCGRVKDALP